jgi:predicted RNase H-like HicB family nuclease
VFDPPGDGTGDAVQILDGIGGRQGAFQRAVQPQEDSMKRRYAMLIERNDGMLWGYFPDLPGCTTGGATRAELLQNAKEALHLYLEDYMERGRPLPDAGEPEDMELIEFEVATELPAAGKAQAR